MVTLWAQHQTIFTAPGLTAWEVFLLLTVSADLLSMWDPCWCHRLIPVLIPCTPLSSLLSVTYQAAVIYTGGLLKPPPCVVKVLLQKMVGTLSLLKQENMSNSEGSWLPPRSDSASKFWKSNCGAWRTEIRCLTAMKIFHMLTSFSCCFFHIMRDTGSHLLSFFIRELQ